MDRMIKQSIFTVIKYKIYPVLNATFHSYDPAHSHIYSAFIHLP